MIPTIGVMIGVYILMRCIVALRDCFKADTGGRHVFEVLTAIGAIITFLVACVSIVSLMESGTRTMPGGLVP